MREHREPGREIEALRDRVSRLGAAILRVSASLDLDTVLREVVDSARALTGARHVLLAPAKSLPKAGMGRYPEPNATLSRVTVMDRPST